MRSFTPFRMTSGCGVQDDEKFWLGITGVVLSVTKWIFYGGRYERYCIKSREFKKRLSNG